MELLPIETKQQRKVIYEMALEKAKNNKCGGLCIDLMNMCGIPFSTRDVHAWQLFPEFGLYVTNDYEIIQHEDLYETDGDAWRIFVLTECIKMCEEAPVTA